MGTDGRPIATGADWMRAVERRLNQLERHPEQSSQDLVGVGFNVTATEVLDWNDDDGLSNGFFWSNVGSLNSPDGAKTWVGVVTVEDDGNHGVQTVWASRDGDPPTSYLRRFTNTSPEDTTATFTDWSAIGTGGGGGSNVITGSQTDDTQTSITSTLAGAGSSNTHGDSAIAIGQSAEADAADAVAVGNGAWAKLGASVALGRHAQCDEADSVAIGDGALAHGATSIAIAANGSAIANGDSSVAIGDTADAESADAIAIGDAAYVDIDSYGGIAIGVDAYAWSGSGSFADGSPIAIGFGADAEGYDSIAIGDSANITTGSSGTGSGAIAIGSGAQTGDDEAIALGWRTGAYGKGCIAIGSDGYGDAARASGDGSIAIGGDAFAVGSSGTPPAPGNPSAIAIGLDSYANSQGISIGSGAVSGNAGISIGALSAWSGEAGQTSVGHDSIISAPYSTGLGYQHQMGDYGTSSAGAYSTTLGAFTKARKDGSVAIGTDHTGAGADSTTQDDFVLGTANHKVKIAGRLNVAQHTPSSSADTQGSVGDITSDVGFLYAKTSAGWKRAALSTF